MDRPNQPAKLHPRHDVLHALEGLARPRPVVQKQQDPSHHLDDEQEEGDAPEEVPIGEPVERNSFLPQWGDQVIPAEPLVEPTAQVVEETHLTPRPAALRISRPLSPAPQKLPEGAAEDPKYFGR